jgi:hypothetical protein
MRLGWGAYHGSTGIERMAIHVLKLKYPKYKLGRSITMIKYTQERLDRELELHRLYLDNDGGARLDLSGNDCSGLDFSGRDLTEANLTEANLTGAILTGAILTGAILEGAKIDYQIQEGLLQQIAQIVVDNPEKLKMDDWHTCETTHCLAGLACHLNPVAKELEKTHGTQIAGLLTLGEEAHSFFSTRIMKKC